MLICKLNCYAIWLVFIVLTGQIQRVKFMDIIWLYRSNLRFWPTGQCAAGLY